MPEPCAAWASSIALPSAVIRFAIKGGVAFFVHNRWPASPGDPQPMFDLIVRRARDLCNATTAGVRIRW
jgi:hypothetical protein